MVKMYSRPQTVNVSAGSENYGGKQNRENRDSKSRDLGSSPSSPAILPGSQAVRHMTLTHGRVGSNPTPAAILIFKGADKA